MHRGLWSAGLGRSAALFFVLKAVLLALKHALQSTSTGLQLPHQSYAESS